MSDSSAGASSPFQQARLLTNERAQIFQRSAETLAERFEDELGRWLSEATIVAEPVEQIELLDLADGHHDLAIIKSQFTMTHGIIATDLTLALSIVAMLCGGAPADLEERPLSRLEMGVFDLVLQPLLQQAMDLFDIGAAELGPHVVSAAALPDGQHEPAIAVILKLGVGETEGQIVLGMSASQLQTYSEEADRKIAGQVAARDEPNVVVARAVQPVVVELIAGFEPLQVPARQLADLQVGDVLRTRQSITRPLVARVGTERLFAIRAAQRGQRLVAELTDHAESPAIEVGDNLRGTSPRPLGGGGR